MTSATVFQIAAMDCYGPPGLTHPLLVENYAWVDQLLREKYYGYALTAQNCDEFDAADLLTENYAWVDRKLEEMCAFNDENWPLALAPITWANYRQGAVLEYLEDPDRQLIGIKRKRSNSDISDYEVEVDRVIKRLRCQSPVPKGKLCITIPNVVTDDEESECDDASSLVSVDLSEITYDEGVAQISECDDEIVTGPWWAVIHPEAATELLGEGYSCYDEPDIDCYESEVEYEDDFESVPYDIDDRSF